MDTKQAAEKLGTTPRVFRVFLRSPMSTFVAVGSGSRYEFTDAEMPTLAKRFAEWKAQGKSKSSTTTSRRPSRTTVSTPRPARRTPSKKDLAVWQEEGTVVIEDIRRPDIRARVKADAKAAEDRLMMLLISRGVHVAQGGRIS